MSHGMLAIGGVISTFLGSIMLIRTSSLLEFAEISWTVIIISLVITTLFFVFLIGLGLKAQRKKPATGSEGLIDMIGNALTPVNPEGTVRVNGEIWQAESIGGTIEKGEHIRVVKVQDLKLKVEQVKQPTSTK